MKRIKLSGTRWPMLLPICIPLIASCSKEDLPVYKGAEITRVGTYHRFYSGDKDALIGENIVTGKGLDRTNDIDSNNGIATTVSTIPAVGGKFIETGHAKTPSNSLVVYVNISIVARITPLDGSPKFGIPIDWTQEHRYSVMTADDTKKIWAIKVSLDK